MKKEKKTYIKNCLSCGIIVQFNNPSGKRCGSCAKAYAGKQRIGYKNQNRKSIYIKKGSRPNKEIAPNGFSNDPNYEGKMI